MINGQAGVELGQAYVEANHNLAAGSYVNTLKYNGSCW